MDRKLKYGLFASFLLWPLLTAALVACCSRLPTTDPENPYAGGHDASHNWVGQDTSAVFGNVQLLLVVIYGVKFLIGRLPFRWLRVYYFALLIIASLPCIWLFLVLDWRNMHVFRFACWVHDPVGFWLIPAVSFAADTVTLHHPRPLWYVGRSCVEFVLMIPWLVVWSFVSFFVLGGGWI